MKLSIFIDSFESYISPSEKVNNLIERSLLKALLSNIFKI